MFETLLPIILAGLMNGSFVIPSKYVKGLNDDAIWLRHCIIALIILPGIILTIVAPKSITIYFLLPKITNICILLSGVIFGFGQICFMMAIKKIGVGASFSVNLGIGTAIGSIFVVLYKKMLFSYSGFFVSLSVLLVITSLFLYYMGSKPTKDILPFSCSKQTSFSFLGWILAAIAGGCSGLQNVAFTTIFFSTTALVKSSNPFWIWPLFLLGAALPMAIVFYYRSHKNYIHKIDLDIYTFIKNIFLITLMGVCFTGSLAIYSTTMKSLNDYLQLFAWPAFMISIILAAQFWGTIEAKRMAIPRNQIYIMSSIVILVLSIVFLGLYSR